VESGIFPALAGACSAEALHRELRLRQSQAGIAASALFVQSDVHRDWERVCELSDDGVSLPSRAMLSEMALRPGQLVHGRGPDKLVFGFWSRNEEMRGALAWIGRTDGEMGELESRQAAELFRILEWLGAKFIAKAYIFHSQELELLGKLSPGMAHDLNNLLTPAWTFLQLEAEGPAVKPDPELRDVALRNLAIVRDYVRQALLFLRTGQIDLQLIEPDRIAREALHRVEFDARERGLRLDLMVEENIGRFAAEAVLVHRLLNNLLRNAMAAAPAGSTIRLSVTSEADRVLFEIADEGPGFPSLEETPKVYAAGRRGLGLKISKKILGLHRGELRVRSEPGQTRVAAIFPRQQSSA
jgi:signal transduction histidine kinase